MHLSWPIALCTALAAATLAGAQEKPKQRPPRVFNLGVWSGTIQSVQEDSRKLHMTVYTRQPLLVPIERGGYIVEVETWTWGPNGTSHRRGPARIGGQVVGYDVRWVPSMESGDVLWTEDVKVRRLPQPEIDPKTKIWRVPPVKKDANDPDHRLVGERSEPSALARGQQVLLRLKVQEGGQFLTDLVVIAGEGRRVR